jgi:hypothetical protein
MSHRVLLLGLNFVGPDHTNREQTLLHKQVRIMQGIESDRTLTAPWIRRLCARRSV